MQALLFKFSGDICSCCHSFHLEYHHGIVYRVHPASYDTANTVRFRRAACEQIRIGQFLMLLAKICMNPHEFFWCHSVTSPHRSHQCTTYRTYPHARQHLQQRSFMATRTHRHLFHPDITPIYRRLEAVFEFTISCGSKACNMPL